MKFVEHGTLHRFDSVAELRELCRAHYPSCQIWTMNEGGDFVLRVRGRSRFDSLIVHFEGERQYAVRLPDSERVSRRVDDSVG